jgi:HK97 family phage major capsid protein
MGAVEAARERFLAIQLEFQSFVGSHGGDVDHVEEAHQDEAVRLAKAVTAAHGQYTAALEAKGSGPDGRQPGMGNGLPFPGQADGTRSPGDVVALKPAERMAPFMGAGAPAGDGIGMGSFLKGVVLGDWSGAPNGFQAAMSVGNDASAGYVVPSRLAGTIIDKARNLTTVIRAGALSVPMDTNTLTIARLATDPTAAWKVENAPGIESAPGFEAVILRARTLVALVKGSVELFEDASDIQGTVDNEFAQVLALELDRAALRGSGAAGEPLGLLNQTGVTVTASVGAPASYIAFADTPTRTLREANAAEPFAFISSPRTFTKLESLVTGIAGDLTRLRPPPAWDAYQKYNTNQVPINLGAGTNETEAYVGDFSQMLIGIRTNLVIEASRVAGDSSSSAFSNLQIWLRAYLRADIGLAHPNHFNVLTGVL